MLYSLKGSLEATSPHWVPHFQRQLLDSPGPTATHTEVSQQQLTNTQQDYRVRAFQATELSLLRTLDLFNVNSPSYHVIHLGYGSKSPLKQVNKCTGVS